MVRFERTFRRGWLVSVSSPLVSVVSTMVVRAVDLHFRRHPESGHPEKDILVPDQKGASIIFSCCLSSLSSGSGLPSKSNTRCLGAKPLVASEMAVSLRVPDYFVSSVNDNGHILPTHSAIKLAQLVCSISGPGFEELSQLADSLPLPHFEDASGGCSTSVSSPLVSVVSGTRCCCCGTDGP